MVMTYSYANIQGQRSVGSEDGVKTNGRMDGGECITSDTNAVGKYLLKYDVTATLYVVFDLWAGVTHIKSVNTELMAGPLLQVFHSLIIVTRMLQKVNCYYVNMCECRESYFMHSFCFCRAFLLLCCVLFSVPILCIEAFHQQVKILKLLKPFYYVVRLAVYSYLSGYSRVDNMNMFWICMVKPKYLAPFGLTLASLTPQFCALHCGWVLTFGNFWNWL